MGFLLFGCIWSTFVVLFRTGVIFLVWGRNMKLCRICNYYVYSESKYRFALEKSIKVSYKILLLSDSTFFKLFVHIFAAIIEALI